MSPALDKPLRTDGDGVRAGHTPGPWSVSLPDETLILDADRNEVARTLGDYDADYERMAADAALIAEAPNLMGECVRAASVLENAASRLRNVHVLLARELEHASARLRSIIAKAEGRS